MDPGILVQLIVEDAGARGQVLSPIRVLKFLCLADVSHTR